MESLILTLPQVIDTALTGSEIGGVSFTLLNNILQVICQQLDLQDVKVQYQGSQAQQIRTIWDPDLKSNIPKSTRLKAAERTEEGNDGDEFLVIPEGSSSYPAVTLTITNSQINNMEKNIEKLQNEVEQLKSLPSNTELLRSIIEKTDESSPLVDMYNTLSVAKRMDATEEATRVLGSIVQDLAKSVHGDDKKNSDTSALDGLSENKELDKLDEEENRSEEVLGKDIVQKQKESLSSELEKKESAESESNLKRTSRANSDAVRKKSSNASRSRNTSMQKSGEIEINKKQKEKIEKAKAIQEEWKNMILTRLNETDANVEQCIDQINKMDSIFSTSYEDIVTKIEDLNNSVRLLSIKSEEDTGKSDMEEHLASSIYEANGKINNLEDMLQKLSEGIDLMFDDTTSYQNKTMKLVEDMNVMKSDKVGRDEFVEALSEKVDFCMINNKVSHDQFNATCDELSKGIEEALEKLTEQEQLWHLALQEIREEVNQKLGKEDFDSLKNFIVEKLRILQGKLKNMSKLREEREAATSKSKFLKEVQCLSCDKDVIMKKKVNVYDFPVHPVLPPHKSIAPNVAYELDYMRRQEMGTKYKDIFRFEPVPQAEQRQIARYCGGKHTVTTPQQRVARLGNFIDQWGNVEENQEISLVAEKLPTMNGKPLDVVLPPENDQEKAGNRFSNQEQNRKISKIEKEGGQERLSEFSTKGSKTKLAKLSKHSPRSSESRKRSKTIDEPVHDELLETSENALQEPVSNDNIVLKTEELFGSEPEYSGSKRGTETETDVSDYKKSETNIEVMVSQGMDTSEEEFP